MHVLPTPQAVAVDVLDWLLGDGPALWVAVAALAFAVHEFRVGRQEAAKSQASLVWAETRRQPEMVASRHGVAEVFVHNGSEAPIIVEQIPIRGLREDFRPIGIQRVKPGEVSHPAELAGDWDPAVWGAPSRAGEPEALVTMGDNAERYWLVSSRLGLRRLKGKTMAERQVEVSRYWAD